MFMLVCFHKFTIYGCLSLFFNSPFNYVCLDRISQEQPHIITTVYSRDIASCVIVGGGVGGQRMTGGCVAIPVVTR